MKPCYSVHGRGTGTVHLVSDEPGEEVLVMGLGRRC